MRLCIYQFTCDGCGKTVEAPLDEKLQKKRAPKGWLLVFAEVSDPWAERTVNALTPQGDPGSVCSVTCAAVLLDKLLKRMTPT